MKFEKRGFLGILVFLGVLYLIWSKNHEDKKVASKDFEAEIEIEQKSQNFAEVKHPARPNEESSIPKIIPSQNKNSKRTIEKESSIDEQKNTPKYSPPPYGYVHFKVVDGWAVSFGDILLGKLKGEWNKDHVGNFQPKESTLWPTSEIPYFINVKGALKEQAELAVQEINSRTVVKFVPYSGQKDYIVFTEGKEHCLSYLGKIGGQQPIFLTENCKKKEIIHELMHALGFIHEQSRVDRDKFLEIHFENIDPNFYMQFDIIPEHLISYYGGSAFLFDYTSVMLYSEEAFAKDKSLKTMTSRTSEVISPSQSLSRGDVERLNKIYNM